jgi:hypothetical protein
MVWAAGTAATAAVETVMTGPARPSARMAEIMIARRVRMGSSTANPEASRLQLSLTSLSFFIMRAGTSHYLAYVEW